MKALVWPVAMYGCKRWTLRKNKETRLDAFETKGLRKILRVSAPPPPDAFSWLGNTEAVLNKIAKVGLTQTEIGLK